MALANTEILSGGHAATEEVVLLRGRCEELELLLGRAVARIDRLERSLDHARSQVAWLHRQLFGSKAERVSPDSLRGAWDTFRKEQEAQALDTTSTGGVGHRTLSPPSYQLLFGLPEQDPPRPDLRWRGPLEG